MNPNDTLQQAEALDASDPLARYRQQFYFPQHNGNDVIYFTGNSLGLQPKSAAKYIQDVLDDWAKRGVDGHFEGDDPWTTYHESLAHPLTKIVGCLPHEVVVMNQLTVNLHLLMVTFYRPTKQRYKIICEAKAFPSDQYAFETHVKHHGLNPSEVIIEVEPRPGEKNLRTEDIIDVIEKNNECVALVLFGGINYYTGQLFNMQRITEAAHKAGAYAGFDLAHAAGNVALHLHDWNVDFRLLVQL